MPTAEDRKRFEELIIPELPFLARVARSMSNSSAEADDLAQDTVVKAFRAIGRFDGRHPRAWLARIARNTAITRAQRNREFLTIDDAALGEDQPDDVHDRPETIVVDSSLDGVLKDALEALPVSFRVVVHLVDVEGMSYQETADALDIPVGTVMSRLHRGRNRLRNALRGTHLERGGSR